MASETLGTKTGRPILPGLAVLLALVFASTSLYSAVNDAPPPPPAATAPEHVVVRKFEDRQGAVPFPHARHVTAGLTCTTARCHHTISAGETPRACTACHTEPATGETPSAKKAFHKACTKCHRETRDAGRKTGPVLCAGCHSG